ncbi:Baseplate hub assembly protein, bacteriophage T4-like [uncultured Caudovirales phage]|uniref:Baseplate hub assembly protein, bacteriophage T4-like n=1 Tax=uncultured Caudovirales phage TaxID=2100421 RepID=A0A6J5N6F2_9CAUD|nr:Baseplate hub assembly protein, bacteriophage T4-like [uncultured Caudovirales phage]
MENQETRTISASENPALAQQLIQAALSMSEEEVGTPEPIVQETPVMEIVPPPSGNVELLAGLYDSFSGEQVSTAEIRELNGIDEEALSKINDYGRGLLEILKRGVVKIGEKDASSDVLDELLAGDREYLLLKIRIATLGKELSLEGPCSTCGEQQTFLVDLEEDIKVKKLEDLSETSITISCKVGEVIVDLPNGKTQKKLALSNNKTIAELDSILLEECVSLINGSPVLNSKQVKQLGMQDRRTILKELGDKNPGPDLSGIVKSCVACGSEVPTPLTLADLFRL